MIIIVFSVLSNSIKLMLTTFVIEFVYQLKTTFCLWGILCLMTSKEKNKDNDNSALRKINILSILHTSYYICTKIGNLLLIVDFQNDNMKKLLFRMEKLSFRKMESQIIHINLWDDYRFDEWYEIIHILAYWMANSRLLPKVYNNISNKAQLNVMLFYQIWSLLLIIVTDIEIAPPSRCNFAVRLNMCNPKNMRLISCISNIAKFICFFVNLLVK